MDVTHFYCIQSVLVNYRNFDGNTTHRTKGIMDRLHTVIKTDVISRYPQYAIWFKKYSNQSGTVFRLRLGPIPLLKIKNNKIYLFEFIPILFIKWR